jgi:hypothetical protein
VAIQQEPAASAEAMTVLCYSPDPVRLETIAAKYRPAYREAFPFPHVAIDGLFPDEILKQILAEIPPSNHPSWTVYGSGNPDANEGDGAKRSISQEPRLGPTTRNFLLQLNSATFITFIESLTGVAGIVGDPTYRGGGIHRTGRSGSLLAHSDADRHPMGDPFNQSINIIIYLNEEWQEAYRGALELWSRDGKQCERRIVPVFNRTVIFESSADTYHGHPEPLECPPDRYRDSLAMYYYEVNRKESEHYSGHVNAVYWLKSPPTTADEPPA